MLRWKEAWVESGLTGGADDEAKANSVDSRCDPRRHSSHGTGTACVGPVTRLAQRRRTGDLSAPVGEIKSIKIFDHHAHPGFGDDSDVDAQATPPQHLPFRERETNPELVVAVKALFDYPYSDMSAEHMRWLQERSSAAEKAGGTGYWDRILDKCGIESSVANRVAMASYLNPKRFRWVFFVDSFLFPFDNKVVTAENPDEGVYIPLQEKVLHRYMQQAGISRLPDSFDLYLAFVSRILEENQKKGGIAEKFEAVISVRYILLIRRARPRPASIRNTVRAGSPRPKNTRPSRITFFAIWSRRAAGCVCPCIFTRRWGKETISACGKATSSIWRTWSKTRVT
jgi:hypothetical protein